MRFLLMIETNATDRVAAKDEVAKILQSTVHVLRTDSGAVVDRSLSLHDAQGRDVGFAQFDLKPELRPYHGLDDG